MGDRRAPRSLAGLTADEANLTPHINGVDRPIAVLSDSRWRATLLSDPIRFVDDADRLVHPALEYAVAARPIGLVLGVESHVFQAMAFQATWAIA